MESLFIENKNLQFEYDDYLMILKGRLLKVLEHQWKQPLNIIATNLINLELKSEFSNLNQDDIAVSSKNIQESLKKISSNITILNRCFSSSSNNKEINVNILYSNIYDLISYQAQKKNFVITKKEDVPSFKVINLENELTLCIFLLFDILIKYDFQKNNHENKFLIEFICESDSKIEITVDGFLNFEELIKSCTLEFFVLQEVIQRLSIKFEYIFKEEKSSFKLIL